MTAAKDLDSATRRYRSAAKALEEARAEVEQAVVAELRAGARPGEVVPRTPFTAAHVRNLARANGIQPPERYQRATAAARRTAASKAEGDA